MASRLIKKTGSTPQEVLSLKKPSNTFRSHQDPADSITNSNTGTDQDGSGNASCELCSDINFESIHSRDCLCCEKVIATSTVRATFANKACPSCQLITRLISSLPNARLIPPESQVSIWLSPYSLHKRVDTRSEITRMNPQKCIQVRLCSHKVNREDEMSVRKCCVIGSLLPVRKDEPPENTGPQRHDELFSTLNYEGVVHARQISRTVDIGLLRAWMGFCEHSHSLCKIVESDVDAKTRLRLIDVLERRLVSSNLNEKYVALSYVWGKGKNEVLRKDSFEHFQCKESLTPEAVPRIVSDAMELVAALGERYLWVDTACIFQDDAHDKQRQLPIMDSIYSHAKLTIIAAVESANNPLPRWNKCHHMMPLRH